MKCIFTALALVIAISCFGCGADPKGSFETRVQMLEDSFKEASKDSNHITLSEFTYDVTKTDSEVAPHKGIIRYTITSDQQDLEGTGGFHNTSIYGFKDGSWKYMDGKLEQFGENGNEMSEAARIMSKAADIFKDKSGIE